MSCRQPSNLSSLYVYLPLSNLFSLPSHQCNSPSTCDETQEEPGRCVAVAAFCARESVYEYVSAEECEAESGCLCCRTCKGDETCSAERGICYPKECPTGYEPTPGDGDCLGDNDNCTCCTPKVIPVCVCVGGGHSSVPSHFLYPLLINSMFPMSFFRPLLPISLCRAMCTAKPNKFVSCHAHVSRNSTLGQG